MERVGIVQHPRRAVECWACFRLPKVGLAWTVVDCHSGAADGRFIIQQSGRRNLRPATNREYTLQDFPITGLHGDGE